MNTRQRIKIGIRSTHRKEYERTTDLHDDYCRDCGDESTPLELHHRSGRWLFGHRKNTIPLCHSCHRRRHRWEVIQERLETMRTDLPN